MQNHFRHFNRYRKTKTGFSLCHNKNDLNKITFSFLKTGGVVLEIIREGELKASLIQPRNISFMVALDKLNTLSQLI